MNEEKQEVITIIQARIKETRMLEEICRMFGIKLDEQRMRNKIGGLMKVIHYIERLP